MIEFNGWISLSIRDDESDTDILKIIDELNILIAPLKHMDNQMFEVKNFNGAQILFIGGNHNHDVGYSDSIVMLLDNITRLAPCELWFDLY